MKEQNLQVQRLEKCLSSVRVIAGWSLEELGQMLGMTRQNVYGIEKGPTHLNQAQYIAIRHLIDYREKKDPENKTLPMMVHLLLDSPEIQDSDFEAINGVADNIAAAASSMQANALYAFAMTLIKAPYIRVSDFTEIENGIDKALGKLGTVDWTKDIIEDSTMEGVVNEHK